MDDWCCHPDPFANRKLLPRAEDCLLGDTFLLLAKDGGCAETLTEEVSLIGSKDGPDSKVRKTSASISDWFTGLYRCKPSALRGEDGLNG